MSGSDPAGGATFAERAAAFAAIHSGIATDALVPNIHAGVTTLFTRAGELPVSVHGAQAGDAWVCSPRTTYSDCAREEGLRYLPRRTRAALTHMPLPIGGLIQWAGVDQSVSINNWLLSTNLYPPLALLEPGLVVQQATARWPEHTIWFRSLNEHDNADWLASLQRAGCKLIASRQVYRYEDFAALVGRHADLKRDLALMKRTPLQYCEDTDITDSDYARIAELYALLYIGKYSRFNPSYGEEFMRLWHRARLLEFQGFRDQQGQLQSVVGMFRQGGMVTAPIVGYNTELPQKLGLYRLAAACAYNACLQNGWRLNFSAGAAAFKRLRGGTPSIEYSAVFAGHLPRRTRLAIDLLSRSTCGIGVSLLRRYRL